MINTLEGSLPVIVPRDTWENGTAKSILRNHLGIPYDDPYFNELYEQYLVLALNHAHIFAHIPNLLHGDWRELHIRASVNSGHSVMDKVQE